jgi:hypothetical protein
VKTAAEIMDAVIDLLSKTDLGAIPVVDDEA